MFRQARTNASKLLAGFLTVVMILSMIPVGIVFNVLAAEVETFTVKLPADVSAKVTVTDDNDATKVFTADTDENFEAVFENLDDETTYTLVVSGMEIYKNYTKTGVVVDAATSLEILDTDLSEKDTQTITFAEESITKTFGDEAFAVALSEAGLGTGVKTYSSTKETVAKINTNGMVTIIGAGTTEIKVSIAADENYKAAEDTFALTVEKAENAIYYTATSVNWVFKDTKTNELAVKEGAVGSFTYASDNDDVAKVDATNGEVTILKPGSANITATFVAGAESNYKDSTASYEITAIKKADALYFETTEINKTYGDSKAENDTLKPADITGTITYESDNESVATVDPTTGEYTIVGAGTATITATLADDDMGYDVASASYTLNVAKKENALSFAFSEQTYTYGDTVVANSLTVALQNLGGFTGLVTYESSSSDIVSVDSSTGDITILKSGDVTITASIAEENNYKAATASYTVKVNKKSVEFAIDETINYGDDDLDLAKQIRDGVIADLATTEKDNADIITRVVGRISYEYPAVPAGELRQVGEYKIKITTEDDDCYSFDLSGLLKVVNNYDADGQYQIIGLNNDKWGSEDNKVIIRVTDTDKYRISKTANHSADWDATELIFDTAEDMNEHIFYIRDIQTNGKHKVSKPIKETFGVDGTNPTVNKFDFKVTNTQAPIKVIHYLTFGLFFNEEVDVTVTASDASFASGVDTITLFVDGEQYGNEPKKVSGNMATFTLTVEKFATLKTISARATDKVGNVSEMTYVTSGEGGNSNFNQVGNGMVQLEQIEADIEVKYDKHAASIDASNNKWYGNDIPFSVKVTDAGAENSGIRAIWATINGATVEIANFTDDSSTAITPYSNNTDGIVSSKDAYYFIDKKTEVVNFTINTDLVTVPANGKYVVEVFAVDNAGTQVKYDEEIIINIDRDDPIITGFEFKAEKSIEGNNQPVATVESYGYFFTQDTKVVVTAKDVRPSAGVKHIEFYTITKEGERKDYDVSSAFVDTFDEDTVIVSATFTVYKGFKGQIYARAVDNVAHTTVNDDNTPKFFNPNGAAIEDADMHQTHSAATVTLVDETTYTDSNNLPLYKWAADDSDETPDGIPVKLYVKDTFSGISSITWKVTAPYNATEEDPAGTTTVGSYLDGAVAVGDVIDGWTVESIDKNLVTEMSKVIYVTNNSNAIKVDLSFNDRALNPSNADPLYFSIDNTIPEINVTYDNNIPDSKYTNIYNNDRVATIAIKERNFNAKDIVFKITSTDGTIPNIDLTNKDIWGKITNEENPDETLNIAEIKYTADGDYTFDISYMDNAENKAATFEQHKFTIDQTLPIISVSYDNNTATNEKYFAKARIATIVIKEHNFDIDRVDFSALTAMLNGNAIDKPEIKWVNEGNVHTATIAFTADGDYTFDIKVTDMAANDNEDVNYGDSVAAKDFVVDQTIVKPTIGGIKNGGAYKEDVVPTISFNDVNYDSYEIKLVRTRMGEKNIDVTSEFIKNITEETQSISGVFDTFDKIVENDGIYTLTLKVKDKAGNEESEQYTFSVNRYGSVYEYSDELVSLIKDGGQYVKGVDSDLIITEYNADKILAGSLQVLITRDGETVDVDFTSTPEANENVAIGESGWYQYVYTIKASNFEKDGVYKISLMSKYATSDSAENDSTSVPENSIDKQGEKIVDSMNFTVDSVAPEIRNVINLDKKIAARDKIIDGKLNVKYTVVDVGGLKTIEIIIDGETVHTLNATDLAENAYNFTGNFDLAEQTGTTAHTVQIKVTDLAGNVTDTNSEEFLNAHKDSSSPFIFFNEVTVSRNFFVRWYANPALFWGSIAGVVVLTVAIIVIIAAKKKKKDEE